MNQTNEAILLAVERGYIVTENGDVYNKRGKKRKCRLNTSGYKRFNIGIGSKHNVAVDVHRLQGYQKYMNLIFNNNLQIRHLDGDCSNNNWKNISIGTCSENTLDVPKERRVAQARLAGSSKWKKILAEGIEFPTISSAARHFEVSQNCIRQRLNKEKEGYKVL